MTHALLTLGYFAACVLGTAAVMIYRFDPPPAGKATRWEQ